MEECEPILYTTCQLPLFTTSDFFITWSTEHKVKLQWHINGVLEAWVIPHDKLFSDIILLKCRSDKTCSTPSVMTHILSEIGLTKIIRQLWNNFSAHVQSSQVSYYNLFPCGVPYYSSLDTWAHHFLLLFQVFSGFCVIWWLCQTIIVSGKPVYQCCQLVLCVCARCCHMASPRFDL